MTGKRNGPVCRGHELANALHLFVQCVQFLQALFSLRPVTAYYNHNLKPNDLTLSSEVDLRWNNAVAVIFEAPNQTVFFSIEVE